MAKKEAKQEAEKVEVAEAVETKEAEKVVKHVKMQKGEIVADVHPDMVNDYAKGGYVEIK